MARRPTSLSALLSGSEINLGVPSRKVPWGGAAVLTRAERPIEVTLVQVGVQEVKALPCGGAYRLRRPLRAGLRPATPRDGESGGCRRVGSRAKRKAPGRPVAEMTHEQCCCS